MTRSIKLVIIVFAVITAFAIYDYVPYAIGTYIVRHYDCVDDDGMTAVYCTDNYEVTVDSKTRRLVDYQRITN